MNTSIKFFLGANSNKGFVSYFEQLQDQENDLRLLVLKGGPGSGKSTLMKRVCEYAKKRGNEIILIPCASDPDSLDAFIDLTENFAMLDGTAPHIVDPSLPGAKQHIMNMGEFWDIGKLKQKRREIANLTDYISQSHKDAGAYIKSAASLYEENVRHAGRFINKKEIYGFSEEIIKALPQMNGGKEYKALLSAVSVGKTVFFDETVSSADGIYALKDEWGAATDYLLKLISKGASAKGINTISCPSSIIPELSRHVIIADTKTAFTSAKEFYNNSCSNVVLEDFYTGIYDEEIMKEREALYCLLIEKACACVKKAKLLHDELEAFYKEAMDFSGMEDIYEKTIKTFY